MQYYLGLDPGLGGGIAIVSGTWATTIKMPATPADLLEALRPYSPLWKGITIHAHAMLERVHSQPKQGHVGAFTYGRGVGRLETALAAAQIPYDEVTPGVWQAAMGCRSKGDKNITKRRAQALFPALTVTHAIADALLLAEYCRRLDRAGDRQKESPYGDRRSEPETASPQSEQRRPTPRHARRGAQGPAQSDPPRPAHGTVGGARQPV